MKYTLQKFSFVLSFFCLFFSTNISAQTPDSTKTDTVKKGKLLMEIGMYSRYIWRGVNFANSPSVQGLLAYTNKKGNFEVGTYGAFTFTGEKRGYGNTIELYATYRYKKFSFTIDDYFFFEEVDSLNKFFDYSQNITTHFIESRVQYDHKYFSLMAAYAFYSRTSDLTRGAYFELGIPITSELKFIAGYLTDASFLNFHDGGGFTNIGLHATREIKITSSFSTKTKIALIANPNYANTAKLPAIVQSPMHFLVGITF